MLTNMPLMYSMEVKQPNVDDQCFVSSSTLSVNNEKGVDIPSQVAGETKTSKSLQQTEKSEVHETVVTEDEALRHVIQKQTVLHEVLVVEDSEETKRTLEVTCFFIFGHF